MVQRVFSPVDALKEQRQLGIRVQLDRRLIDLADEDVRLLRDLLARHGVLCLINQPVHCPRQLHGFASQWGEVIELTRGLSLDNQEPSAPSITRIGNIRSDGTIIPSVRFAEYWHHDGDFWQPGDNFIVNFLSAVRVPATGGQTGLFDSKLAYETLDDATKAELADAYICVRAKEINDFREARPKELPPDATHPVLLRHPLTMKIALYLPDSSTGIQKADGSCLGAVKDWIESLQIKLGFHQHEWQDGDLLIMDNLQVMHRSMGGYGDNPRLLYRCQSRMRAENPGQPRSQGAILSDPGPRAGV